LASRSDRGMRILSGPRAPVELFWFDCFVSTEGGGRYGRASCAYRAERRKATKATSKGPRMPNLSPIMPPASHFHQLRLWKSDARGGLLTEIADALAEHEAALELAKHSGAAERLDNFAGDDVDDETVARELPL
jgi:hypothetical protein